MRLEFQEPPRGINESNGVSIGRCNTNCITIRILVRSSGVIARLPFSELSGDTVLFLLFSLPRLFRIARRIVSGKALAAGDPFTIEKPADRAMPVNSNRRVILSSAPKRFRTPLESWK